MLPSSDCAKWTTDRLCMEWTEKQVALSAAAGGTSVAHIDCSIMPAVIPSGV